MSITSTTRQAYAEVDELLGLLSEEEREEIPLNLRETFKREKDKNYFKIIDINTPIKDQNLKEETLAIIAFLNLNYWCKDETEKERLMRVYSSNEQKYKENIADLQVGYDPEAIFGKQEEEVRVEEPVTKEMAIAVVEKESIITKIINKIKELFQK